MGVRAGQEVAIELTLCTASVVMATGCEELRPFVWVRSGAFGIKRAERTPCLRLVGTNETSLMCQASLVNRLMNALLP